MINSGNNILRFVKMATARSGTLFLYKFTADALHGEHIDFVFQVTEFGELPWIIRDLILLTQKKKWWDVLLVEAPATRMLMIKSIKEPKQTQEELNEISRIKRITVAQ